MRILNLGSLNIDKVYSVSHFVREGETISCAAFNEYSGGKGLNQSVALSRAGAAVFHAGAVGDDGGVLVKLLSVDGCDTHLVRHYAGQASGHAVIQVSGDGKNCIIVHGGTNQLISETDIDTALQDFSKGDALLLQNETSNVDYAIRQGKKRGLSVVFNPSPIKSGMLSYPLNLVDIFILNETEGKEISGQSDPQRILHEMDKRYPGATVVLTLGAAGVIYKSGSEYIERAAFDVPVVDTTAAGDTFAGYFLAGIAAAYSNESAIDFASAASALAIMKSGAAVSIPFKQEVDIFLKQSRKV
ncbi:MAG: ribokinase [Termitinemataceae bacterium]|nr:MAG: ribokinase [Termitinemataceae bacterium]